MNEADVHSLYEKIKLVSSYQVTSIGNETVDSRKVFDKYFIDINIKKGRIYYSITPSIYAEIYSKYRRQINFCHKDDEKLFAEVIDLLGDCHFIDGFFTMANAKKNHDPTIAYNLTLKNLRDLARFNDILAGTNTTKHTCQAIDMLLENVVLTIKKEEE